MSTTEIAEAIVASRRLTIGNNPIDSTRIAEILRYQTRKGTVRRVSHGVYIFVPGSMARTTQWRCERWERWYDEEQDRRAEWARARDSIDKGD
jgi:hypothetical protein